MGEELSIEEQDANDNLCAFRMYMDLLKDPVPPREQIEAWAREYEADGSKTAFDSLIKSQLRLVVKIAHQISETYHIDISRLIEAGHVGLVKGMPRYDAKKGALSTFAAHLIKGACFAEVQNKYNENFTWLGSAPLQILFFNEKRIVNELTKRGQEPTPENISALLNSENRERIEKRLLKDGKTPTPDNVSALLKDRKVTPEHVITYRKITNFLSRQFSLDDDSDDSDPSRDGISPDNVLGNNTITDPLALRIKEDSSARINQLFSEFELSLSDRREVVILRELMLSEDPRTQQNIADQFNVTRSRIQQLQAKLMGKLRCFFEANGVS